MKRRFRILLLAPEYNLEIQARIPAALCSIHNFIRTHGDQLDRDENLVEPDCINDCGDHDHVAEAAAVGPDEPSARRDQIAQQMWDDYVEICNERDHENQELEDEEDGDEDEEDGDENEDEDDDDEV